LGVTIFRTEAGKRSVPFLAGTGALVGSLVAVAVPTLQGIVVWRTRRPYVPGPHLQDGLVTAMSDAEVPLTLVWLGDSLASGVGARTPEASLPRKAAALCSEAAGRSIDLTCLARPGACAGDVLAEQVPAAIARLGPGAVTVVTVGSNDLGSLNRPRRFRRDYAAILESLSDTGATVIAVGLPHIGSAAVMARPLRTIAGLAGRHADRQVRRLAEAHGAQYVHIAERAPWGTKPMTYLAADHWHPNDSTYQLWASRVAALLSPTPAVGLA
jgi:lysophospholipase L1-like esterase